MAPEPFALPFVDRPLIPVTAQETTLRARLNALADDRLSYEMSDDFAYTNGTMSRLDREMADVRAALHEMLNPKATR